MRVFCTGMVRSGSTWSYTVICRLLRAAFPDRTVANGYTVTPGALADELARTADLVVVKTHVLDDPLLSWAKAGTANLVHTVRSPGSAVVSGMQAFGHSFEQMLGSVQAALEVLDRLEGVPRLLLIDHDEIERDPLGCVRRIAGFLPVDLPMDTLAAISRETGKANMKRLAASIPARPEEEVVRIGGDLIHKDTHLHHNHFSPVDIRDWRGFLAVDQVTAVEGMVRRWALRRTNAGLSVESLEFLRDFKTRERIVRSWPVSLDDLVIYDHWAAAGASREVLGTGALKVVTMPGQWAYAAACRIDVPAIDRGLGFVRVSVRAGVARGAALVMFASAGMDTAFRQDEIGSEPSDHVFDIPDAIESLTVVVRNGGDDAPSEVVVSAIRVEVVEYR